MKAPARSLVAYFSGPRRGALLGSALIAAVLLLALQWGVERYQDAMVAQARSQLVAQLTGYENALSSAMNRCLLSLDGLRAYAEGALENRGGQILPAEFQQVAHGLYDSAPGIQAIWLAKGGVLDVSYPPGQTGAGVDLLRSLPAERANELENAIRSRQISLGPVQQAADGWEAEGRLAVFYQSRFWGLVTVSINLRQVFAEAGLTSRLGEINTAVRDSYNQVLLGEASVFDQDPAQEEVSLPQGSWSLAGAPAQGWAQMVAGPVNVVRWGGAAIILALAALVYLTTDRQVRLQAAVAQRTHQLDQELTERARVETEVRDSEQRYRALVETAPDAVLLQDLEGRIVEFNDAACAVFGYTRDELDGRPLADLLPPEVARMLNGTPAPELNTGPGFVETRYRRKNGQIFPAEVSSNRVSVTGQGFVINYVRDITRRKEAEEEIRQGHERYRSLVETSPDAIALVDTRGRILLANRKAAQLYDYDSPEQLAGVRVFELVAPEDRERALESARSLLHGGPYREVEFISLSRKGRRFPSEISGTAVFDSHGKPVGFTGVARDISERKLQAREQAALVVVASALRTAVTLEGISENILNQLLGLLASEGAALFVILPATGESLCVRGVARWQSWSGVHLAKDEGLTTRVVSTGQPYVNNDIQHNPQTARLELMGGLNAIAGVPLISAEHTIGALWVGRSDPFREGELRVLMVIADMVASAVQRASLYEETSRRLQRLDALHQIDQTITAAQSLRTVLDFLLDKVMTHLAVDAAGVFLVEENGHSLYFLAGKGFRRASLRGLRLEPGEGCAGQVAAQGRTVSYADLRQSAPPGSAAQLEGEGFISYCGLPLVAKQQLRGVLEVYNRTYREPDPEWLDFLETLAGQAAIAIDNSILLESLQHSNQELALAYERTLEGWARALELRDKETEGHTRRAADRTVEMGRAMGMSNEELVQVRRGALLHDIGKLGIPDKILLKPGPLSEDEWQVMRLHPTYARNLLEPIPYLRPALAIPYCHHEHWDGSGYPQGLQGENIPLAARIFAVIDVWDALSSDRVYRPAWNMEKVREYLRQNTGILFDPQAVEAFFRING